MHLLRQMANRGRIGALLTLSCVLALVFAAGVDARPSAQRATFRVTVSAQITKRWDYVTTREEGDCAVSTRVEGTRTVVLRSARPTIVTASSASGGIRFSPALVGSVTARASQGGAVTTNERGLGCTRRTHSDCAKPRRTLVDQTLRFFRSRRNEISFRRTRDFAAGFTSNCPPEAAEVRVERPGLHDAEGKLRERDVFTRGARTLTAGGRLDQTIELEGDPDGKVLIRVSWTLTFRRVA
jgi:hypothetical protein